MKSRSPIPVFRPRLVGGEARTLWRTLKSGWWGTGPRVAEFEAQFARYTGVLSARCLMVTSCTSALHLAVTLFPRAERFLVPGLTFLSSALAPRYERKTVEFVEVGDDLCLDQDDVLRKLRPGDVVIAVHMGGHVADLSRLRGVCDIIEDCAHALGSTDEDGHHVGTKSVGCFSFQATKSVPIGDGGMLVLPWEHQRPVVEARSWCGIASSTWDRTAGGPYQWRYAVHEIGYKYRANDVMAALALDQWRGLEATLGARQRLAERYTRALGKLDWLRLPTVRPRTAPNWQEYIVRTRYRDRLHDHLDALGIATTVHYYPVHLYPPLHWIDEGLVCPQKLPVTERLWQEILTIPCYAGMSVEDQERVVDGIRRFKP